jgi:hemolysin III
MAGQMKGRRSNAARRRYLAAVGESATVEAQAYPHPIYGRGERIADRCIHYAGLVAGVIGAVVLVVAAAERARALTIVSVSIYGVGLLGMISASALYNLAAPSRRKELLRRLDHAAIFLVIAGTYTPFTLVRMGGGWGFGIATFVWVVAVMGIALKVLYPRRFEGLSILLYLALGWTIAVAHGPLLDAVPLPAVFMLGIGGLLYSLGVVFHVWHRLPYHNAIWHAFVLGATGCQWVAVLNGVVRAA